MNFIKCPKCGSTSITLNTIYGFLDILPYRCLGCGYRFDTKDEQFSKLHLASPYGKLITEQKGETIMQEIISVYNFCKRYLLSSQRIVILDSESDYVYFKGYARDITTQDIFNLRLYRIEPDATGTFKNSLLLYV